MIALPPLIDPLVDNLIALPPRPADPAAASTCARAMSRSADLLRALGARLEPSSGPTGHAAQTRQTRQTGRVGWIGRSAAHAAAAEQAHRDRLASMADAFAVAAAALESWAYALAYLVAQHETLAHQTGEHHRRVVALAGLPAGTPGAEALRAEATRDGLDLAGRVETWRARAEQARDEVTSILRWQADLAPGADRGRRAIALATDRAMDAGVAAGAGVRLVDYDSAAFGGDGSVAIAFDEAEAEAARAGAPSAGTTPINHTAVVVPGITNDASSIASQAVSALALLGAAAPAAGRTSVVAWMGYDAPSHPALQGDRRLAPRELRDLGRTLSDGAAEDGGRRLVGFVEELRAAEPSTELTTIGHSYGSTTAAHAAVAGLDTDNLVLLGSPGAGHGVETVADLALPSASVFVGAADNDPVTWIGGGRVGVLGADPAHESFGSTRIPVAAGPHVHLDEPAQVVLNHNSYFAPDSTSLTALAAITVGDSPATVPGRTQSGAELFTGWGVREAAYAVVNRDVEVLWR